MTGVGAATRTVWVRRPADAVAAGAGLAVLVAGMAVVGGDGHVRRGNAPRSRRSTACRTPSTR